MHCLHSLFVAAGLAVTVSAHGLITSPAPRAVGSASTAACGTAVTAQIVADNTSHVEGLPEASLTDPTYDADACNLWLCKGLQYADNTDNVLLLSPGEEVPIEVFIRIPHAGTANVSIVDTKENVVLGNELLYWDSYADEKLPTLPANNSVFSVTIPRTLDGKCLSAGDCVIQWWWYGVGAKQTYESCLDFVLQPLTPRAVPPQGRRSQ